MITREGLKNTYLDGFYDEAIGLVNHTFANKAKDGDSLIRVKVYDKRYRDKDINFQEHEWDWENLTGFEDETMPTFIPVHWIRSHKGGDTITITLRDGRKMKI